MTKSILISSCAFLVANIVNIFFNKFSSKKVNIDSRYILKTILLFSISVAILYFWGVYENAE